MPITNRILLTLVMLAVAALGAGRSLVAAADDAGANKAAFDTFIEVLNNGGYEKLTNAFADDFRRRAPDFNADSRAGMMEGISGIHAAYPDFAIVVNAESYSDDISFAQWTVNATGTREDGSQAPLEIHGATMLRYADGLIIEEWVYFDSAQFAEQLGSIPHAE